MITYFMQLNVKLLFVLILFGFIMGQTRHAAIQNFSNKNRSYLILDFFNLVGTPVHEIGHLLFGLIFGYKIDQNLPLSHYQKGTAFRRHSWFCENAS